jgi:hypothetical protein
MALAMPSRASKDAGFREYVRTSRAREEWEKGRYAA